MPRLLFVAALLLAVPLNGCIEKSKYLDLEASYEATREELQDRIAALQGQVAALESELSGTRKTSARDLGACQSELKSARDRIAALQAEAAALLKDKSKLKASVDDMASALADLERRRAAAERRVASFQDMLARFQKLIDAGTLRVKIVDGRMVVELATDILFDSGSAKLSEAGTQALQEVAVVLQDIPERSYQVEGHTDNDPIKTTQYPSNWELASGRALRVVRTMVGAGLSPERVSAASFGEYKPAASNDTPEDKALNRRIEIVVIPDLSDLPGFDELRKLGD
jgi:chemotaxis protein MotB